MRLIISFSSIALLLLLLPTVASSGALLRVDASPSGSTPGCIATSLPKLFGVGDARAIVARKRADSQALELIEDRPGKRDSPVTDRASAVLGDKLDLDSPLGHRRLIRRKSGKPWDSTHRFKKNAVQGDARQFIFAADSVEVGKFFGFEIRDANTLAAPGAKRLNSAIDQLNQVSPRLKLRVRFEPASGKISDLDFAKGFVERGVIPIDENSVIMIHDVNYHAGTVLIPQEEIDLARRHGQAIFDFMQFVKRRDPELFTSPKIAKGFDRMLYEYAFQVDSGTGDTVVSLATDNLDEAYEYASNQLAAGRVSPSRRLSGLINHLSWENAWGRRTSKIRDLEDEFIKLHRHDPGFDQDLPSTRADFVKRVKTHRDRLKAAVYLLQHKSSGGVR
jgi:hypothetical protein